MAEVLIEVSQGLALGDRQVIRTLLRIIECNFKIVMLIEPEELIRTGRLLLTDVLFACHFYVFVIGCILDNMLGAAAFNKSDLPALESSR